jgi:hypothetical protein
MVEIIILLCQRRLRFVVVVLAGISQSQIQNGTDLKKTGEYIVNA